MNAPHAYQACWRVQYLLRWMALDELTTGGWLADPHQSARIPLSTVSNMLSLEPGLYLRVEELINGPKPFPLQSGFSTECAYRALGLFNPSETSDAYFVLSNDRDEVWFICNRHLRTVGLFPKETDMRVSSLVLLGGTFTPAGHVGQ